MKKIVVLMTAAMAILIVALVSCKSDPALDSAPDAGKAITFNIPKDWPQPVYKFLNNQLTQSGFELGKKLFYDPRLSRDNTVSCGSCHEQYAAFSHLDHTISHGVDGRLGTRNTPGLYNLAWHPAFFWDGGVNNLESQPINPIQNHVEMDLPINEVVARVDTIKEYSTAFQKAFGDTLVSSQRIFKALAQFMACMISSDSKYDKRQRGEQGGTFTTQEEHGLALFQQNCQSCHKPPLFSDFSYRNNGLTPDPAYNDSGRAHITGLPQDRYKFMVPSLRNIELSRPYMHDGRIRTLEAAVDHYRNGIFVSPTLDTIFATRIQMNDNDRDDLVAFLKTLTDQKFVTDQRFAQP